MRNVKKSPREIKKGIGLGGRSGTKPWDARQALKIM
jgi:hypothetical protein